MPPAEWQFPGAALDGDMPKLLVRPTLERLRNAPSAPAVHRELQQLTQRGLMPHVLVCNAALAQLLKLGALEDAVRLFDFVNDDARHGPRLVPNLFTFTSTMAALGHLSRWQRAMELLRDMSWRGLEPSVITYNHVLGACARGGQLPLALELLNDMRRARVYPDSFSYSTVIQACGHDQACEWQRVLSLLDEMHATGVQPDVFTYSAAMNVCAQARQWQVAVQLLRDMEARGLLPNSFSYTAVIQACAACREADQAFDIYAEMVAWGCAPAPATFHALLTAAERSGRWEDAVGMLPEMRARGVTPIAANYGSVMFACLKNKQYDTVLELMEEMRRRRVSPTLFCFNTAITACGVIRNWAHAMSLLRGMRKARVLPTTHTYEGVLNALGRSGQIDRALELLNEMLETGVPLTVAAVNTVLAACGEAARWRDALSLLHKAADMHDIQPNFHSYRYIVTALESGGESAQADAYFREGQSKGGWKKLWQVPGSCVDLRGNNEFVKAVILRNTLLDLAVAHLRDGSALQDVVLIMARGKRVNEESGLGERVELFEAHLQDTLGLGVTRVPDAPDRLLLTKEDLEAWVHANSELVGSPPPAPVSPELHHEEHGAAQVPTQDAEDQLAASTPFAAAKLLSSKARAKKVARSLQSEMDELAELTEELMLMIEDEEDLELVSVEKVEVGILKEGPEVELALEELDQMTQLDEDELNLDEAEAQVRPASEHVQKMREKLLSR